MKKSKIKLNFLVFNLCFWLLVFGFGLFAKAQTNSQVIIAWQAQDFSPAEYQGKTLPSLGSNIKLSLELVIQNKLQDLSKADIIWYADGKLLGRALGLKQTNFTANKGATDSYFIRAVINYKSQTYEGAINLPIVSPKIIIEIPSPADNFIISEKNIFQASPYFFNINNMKDLSFNWSVNNQITKGSNLLELDITPPFPSNQNFDIKVAAQNLNNKLEFSSKEINLHVK